MDFMKMLEDWRRILGRSVFVFHIMSVAMGLVVLFSVTSFPYLNGSFPENVELGYAFVGGLLGFFASCAFGGAVRYAFYGDFKLMPSRSFRHYFSGDGEGEQSAYIAQALPARSQRGHDDDLIDGVGEMLSSGDVDGFMELFNRFQSTQTIPPGEISDELTPRIRELGLERNCEELWEQGYTVIEDAAPSEYWQELRKMILKAGYPGARGSDLMEKYSNVVAEATINPKMMALAEFSVGAGFILSNVASSIRRKGDRNIGLHCDQVWHPVPFPDSNLFLTACWACDDFTLESGATTVVPGSASFRRPPNMEEVATSIETVPIECKAGSIAVWDGRTWHDNADRTIDGERAVLHVSYTRLAMRQMEVYSRSVQDKLIEQFGEPMAQLMSRYDFLAKPEGKANLDGFMRAIAYARR